MQIRNTTEKYGVIAKSLHWIVSIAIIAVWAVGYYAADLPREAPEKSQLYGLHKSVGMAILMLAAIRLSWRLYDLKLQAPASLSKPMATLAHSVHYFLYALMFIQPLTGWAMSSAAGYNPSFFGLFTFPGLVPHNPENAGFYAELHEICAYVLLGLFILHVAGALYHYFVLKDKTLQRML